MMLLYDVNLCFSDILVSQEILQGRQNLHFFLMFFLINFKLN